MRVFKTRRFTIRVRAVEDYDLDLSFDDTGEVRAGLESGKFVSFGVIATVYLDGTEVAEDSLWGCIYESPEQFMDHKECAAQTRELRAQGKTGVVGSYFSDMITIVCRDARKTLSNLKTVRVR